MTHWKDRHRIVPAVYLVLRRDGKILIARRAGTGYRDGFYSFPAGHVDGKEPAVRAMVREAKEEVGVAIKPEDLKLILTFHRVAESGDYEYVDFYFEATTWQGEPSIMEPDKCDDLQWVAPDNLPGNMIPVVREALAAIAAGKPYEHANFS